MSRPLDHIDAMLLDAAERRASRFCYVPEDVCPACGVRPLERHKGDCEWVFRATVARDPDPAILQQLIESGRAEVKRP